MKSVIKLTLPKVRSKLSFYVKFDDQFYSPEQYKLWQSRGFQVDPLLFQSRRLRRLRTLGRLGKAANKKQLLKVKLLCDDQLPDPERLESLGELFALERDVIVFVTGGGFVSDFEKIAQFYLREITKDLSMPIFIVKYRLIRNVQSGPCRQVPGPPERRDQWLLEYSDNLRV